MEDGAKEDPAQCKEPKFLTKAGWLKKAPGKLLASYKDRYIQVEKTVVVVYENEDLQNCLERLDLENYDKCHELKSPFKKKQRLVLIRSAKSGNKVQDVKFQAQTAEEKEAWIKALSDGINRAKNKIFDEVKIDESSNLEHVTRTRPKGNRNRRPPTRIHMKEVAVMSSDGILRLDLDLEDALMPNGTHQASVDSTEAPKGTTHVPTSISGAGESNEKQSGLKAEEDQAEPEVTPQKKIIKPPMPPTKEAKPSTIPEDEPDTDNVQVKKVPPMPPSKEAKPVSSVEETTEKAKAEKMPEKSPDARKKTGPPPTPPSKPSSSGSLSNLAESSQSQPNTQPPTLPLKEKKPCHDAVKSDQKVQDATENREKEDKEAKGKAMETDKAEKLISQETLPEVGNDEPKSPSTEENLSEEESGETPGSGVNKSSDNELQTSTEPLRKSPSPPPPPKKNIKKPFEPDMQHIEDKTTITHPPEGKDPAALLQPASDTSASSLHVEVPVVVVSLNDSYADSLSLSPVLYRLQEGKKKEEEKSVDSGQHSDDDSEVSGSEDTLAVTTTANRAGLAGWNVFDGNEDDIQSSANPSRTQPTAKPQVSAQCSEPTSSPKTLTKGKSASIGDLLSDSIQVRRQTRAVAGNDGASSDDVMKLEAEVALEMEKTSRLLSRVSQSQKRGDVEPMPEDLLAKAMEKLKKADDVLREVQKLKPANNTSSRKSW